MPDVYASPSRVLHQQECVRCVRCLEQKFAVICRFWFVGSIAYAALPSSSRAGGEVHEYAARVPAAMTTGHW